jgi:hypothetical protein
VLVLLFLELAFQFIHYWVSTYLSLGPTAQGYANIVRQLLTLGTSNKPRRIDVHFFKTNHFSSPGRLHTHHLESQVFFTMD